MRFTPKFLDEIRARLPTSQVVARKVALKRAGREFRGLSPFKVEKTPSFFVNDQKGFYKCFSSGEHGDIFTFVMKTEGLSFTEAVERLAAEAGLPLPANGPAADPARDGERQRIYVLLEAAAAFFEQRLASGDGAEARRYLDKRGLARQTIADFRLGFAPAGRSVLKDHLAKAGFTMPEMIASGMLIAGDDIAVPYDRFRNRVMFPITDLKGRIIAFGGRALDANQPAKYLNSPETPLFHKGAILFNAAKARAPAHERGQIIAVEGYMDVVSLVQAGFGQAVAPLGTALTEAQVELLWRFSPEPVLCFDGDSAGRRAAYRAVDTVLPRLKPGYSARFAFLDDGLDPDDMIQQHGPEAFARVIGKARPLFDVMFEREEQRGPLQTADQLADLQTRLQKLVAAIPDRTVRFHYERELRETVRQRTREAVRSIAGSGGRRDHRHAGTRRRNTQADWRTRLGPMVAARPRATAIAASNELTARDHPAPAREVLLLRTLINHPWLIDDHAEEIAALSFTASGLAGLRDALLTLTAAEKSLDSTTVHSQLKTLKLGRVVELVERASTHKSDKFAEPGAERADVERGWRHVLALHDRQNGLRQALEAAERAFVADGSEAALARICEIQRSIADTQVLDIAI